MPEHSESESQSPPPTSHGLVLLQQLQSVEGTPSHDPDGGVVVVGAVVVGFAAVIQNS